MGYTGGVPNSPGSHGEIGRRNGLKIRWPQGRAGSIPAESTTLQRGQRVEFEGLLKSSPVGAAVEYDGVAGKFTLSVAANR